MEIVRLRMIFAGIVAVLTLAWVLSVDRAQLVAGFWTARTHLIPFTGILAIGFMSIAVLLAARPVQVEAALGGLDKFYRLHKWLGMGSALMALVHWGLEVVPRSLVQQGWLVRPKRAGSGAAAAADPFAAMRPLAIELGEWTLYLLLILVALALWKRFPYHLFFKTHRLMAALFLVLVFHAVVLMPTAFWTAPVGPLMALLLVGAMTGAGLSLFRRIGKSRRAVGEVTDLQLYSGNAMLDVGVRLATAWPGHTAGQFAFLDFEDEEGAHPFTISSAWRNDGRLVFSIKGIGDYTRTLPQALRVGEAVTVEGPYGRFDFRGEERPQVWIAGGVGITPFVARLQALVDRSPHSPHPHPIDLIYSTATPDDGFIDQVRSLAESAGVGFHLVESRKDGYLTLDRLAARNPRWCEADVWFCGPQGFGQSLREAMTANGLPASRFHQELFEMR